MFDPDLNRHALNLWAAVKINIYSDYLSYTDAGFSNLMWEILSSRKK